MIAMHPNTNRQQVKACEGLKGGGSLMESKQAENEESWGKGRYLSKRTHSLKSMPGGIPSPL
jgi:hypothetical protein